VTPTASVAARFSVTDVLVAYAAPLLTVTEPVGATLSAET
jgi:hypothetical protein